MATAHRKLTVEIAPGSNPISGRITDENGSRPFTGWLQLAVALEATASTADSGDDDEDG